MCEYKCIAAGSLPRACGYGAYNNTVPRVHK